MSELKLFVWDTDDVLVSYSSGLICVLAHNPTEALELIRKKCSYCMDSFPHDKFKVITEPEAFICYGGD